MNYRKKIIVPILLLLLIVPQFAYSKSRDDYKKEIELKGITYSRESFLEEVFKGNNEIAGLFIKAGIDVNAKNEVGVTALMWAASAGEFDLTRLLIEKGADVNARDIFGRTALLLSTVYMLPLEIELSQSIETVISYKDLYELFTLGLITRSRNATAGNIKIIKLLIGKGADVNAKSKYNLTALHWAVASGNIEIVKLLLKRGADVNVKTEDGKTALEVALSKDSLDIAKELRKAGAKEKRDKKEKLPKEYLEIVTEKWTKFKFSLAEFTIEVKNTSDRDIKDISFKVFLYGESGTKIDTIEETVYTFIPAGSTKTLVIEGWAHPQARSSLIFIDNAEWK